MYGVKIVVITRNTYTFFLIIKLFLALEDIILYNKFVNKKKLGDYSD